MSEKIKRKQHTADEFEIFESTESKNKSSIKIITSKYRWYNGIVFDINYFAVLDFIWKHRIVIIFDEFENNWQQQILGIIKENLNSTEQTDIIVAYKPREGRKYLSKK